MPTNVTDQFYEFDPADPPPVGTTTSFFNYVLTDQNDDGDIDEFDFDAVTGLDVTASWPGDTITLNVAGTGDVTYTGTTLYLSDGSIIFTPTDGQVLQPGTFVSSTFVSTQGPLLLSQLGPPCFTLGTMIGTPSGEKPIEYLSEGDYVQTLDAGPVPIRFLRRRTLGVAHLHEHPRHAPVSFSPGSLGEGLPTETLCVSPQHRMLVRSKLAKRMFGHSEIMVPAANLIGAPGVRRSTAAESVTYIHILLDQHHVLFANGAETESLLLGANVMSQLSRTELIWLKASAPQCLQNATEPARYLVSGKPAKSYLRRAVKNGLPLTSKLSTLVSA